MNRRRHVEVKEESRVVTFVDVWAEVGTVTETHFGDVAVAATAEDVAIVEVGPVASGAGRTF